MTALEAEVDNGISKTGVAVLDKLTEQEQQRRVERDRRREEAKDKLDPRESVQKFLKSFSTQHQTLETTLQSLISQGPPDSSNDAARTAVSEQLDKLAAEALLMEKQVAEASYYLPTYDQKQCTATLADVKTRVEAARGELLPKRKFAFSSRKVNRVKGAEAAAAAAAPPAAQPAAPAAADAGCSATAPAAHAPAAAEAPEQWPSEFDLALVRSGRGLMGLRNQVVVKTAEELASKDFVLLDLQGCTVYLLGHMAALRMLRLRDTRVYAGPVTSSCFVDEVTGCNLVLASYQVRIHRTEATDFYLRVRSKPIIEHSHGVRFAPYALEHEGVQALLARHKLGEESGMYCQVDDFGWIKAVQSPNWSVLPEAERMQPHRVPQELLQQQEQKQGQGQQKQPQAAAEDDPDEI